MEYSRGYAQKLDALDELARYREEFYLPHGALYLDGNSLGPLSKRAEKTLLQTLETWKELGIGGWLDGPYPWFYLAEKLGEMMAPLVGALPNEIIVTGSTTVNLHQLVATFYVPKGRRVKILIDEFAFSSDVYALQSQLRLHGQHPETDLVVIKSHDGKCIEEDDVIAAMNEGVALIVLPTVQYRSGQLFDIERITRKAHARGILVGFDACHSVGVVPHQFHEQGVDFAFFCTYKYLNGGPGAVGGLFVHQKHLGRYPALAGWFGSNKEVQFDMSHRFVPADTAGVYQIGTPHILSMAPLIGSLEIFNEIGIERIRKKSLRLTQFLMDRVTHELRGMDFTIVTPLSDMRRGGHVALEHPEAVRICKALKAQRVVPDFRPPNIVRLAPVPLYTSFMDVWETVQKLKTIMEQQLYIAFSPQREIVA